MLKRSKKILLEGTLDEFKNYPRGAEGREYVLMNIEEKKPDGSYAFYEKDEKGDIIPVSYEGTEGYDATEFSLIIFDDPEFERVILQKYDTNNSGKLTNKELSYIDLRKAFVDNKNIISATDLLKLKVKDYASAFFGCTNLTTVAFPKNLNIIPQEAFRGCSSLTTVVIPDGITKIENSAFAACENITSIEIPNTVTKIGGGAFSDTNISSIVLPENVDEFGDSVFRGCTNLTSVNLPQGMTKVGSYTFYLCTNLTSVSIPMGVTTIEWQAFCGCSNLESIELPDSVTSISSNSFLNCKLSNIKLSNNLSTLPTLCLLNCKFSSIEIPSSVTSIDSRALEGCTDLVQILFHSDCNLKFDAFPGCSSMTLVVVDSLTPPNFTVNSAGFGFGGVLYSRLTLYVPEGTRELYQQHPFWSNFTNIEEGLPSEE